jgi:Protein of unknown function with HXXEE motif
MRRERWPWLFPATYVLHIVEEYAGGFPRWLAAVAGARLSEQDFLIINAVALVVMTIAVTVCVSGAVLWPLVALATVVTVNAALHIGGSILTSSYSPGAITATLLWLPLGVFGLRTLRTRVERGPYVAAMIVGLAGHALVSAIAMVG